MTKSLEIDGKEMSSIRSASEGVGYSPDYLTRLAREGKIAAVQVNRNWFVDMDSVRQYVAAMELEQKLRQQQLSDERKRELQLNELFAQQRQATVQPKNIFPESVIRFAMFAAFALIVTAVGVAQYSSRTGSFNQVAALEQVNQSGGAPVVLAADAPEATQLNFSHESSRLSTLGDATHGVLLLPENVGSSSPEVSRLFSDEVTLMTDDVTGEKFVARLNDKGEVVEKMPFVVVPVTNSETP